MIQSELNNRSVLVMDDEQDILKLYKITLERLGCKPILVDNGRDAIEQYQTSMASGKLIDIVILDLNIPGDMDGIDVAGKIFALNPEAKIILASGYPEGGYVDKERALPFTAVIEKSFNRSEIKSLLEKALSSS